MTNHRLLAEHRALLDAALTRVHHLGTVSGRLDFRDVQNLQHTQFGERALGLGTYLDGAVSLDGTINISCLLRPALRFPGVRGDLPPESLMPNGGRSTGVRSDNHL